MQISHDRSAWRILIYRLFSDLFAQPPDAEKITQLGRLAAQEDLTCAPCLAPLMARILLLGENPNAAAKDLMGRHSFLFLGAGGPQSIPPSHSPWVDPHGRNCQQPAAAMARILAELGMHVADTFFEPPDHIAVIFAAAAQLIEAGATPKRQASFLKDHLADWLPDFSAACALSDPRGVYALLARTARDFVDEDLKWLGALPAPAPKEEKENV